MSSPHIHRVLEARALGAELEVVSEAERGVTLERLLQRGPLSPAEAAAAGDSLLEALSAIDAAGLSHGAVDARSVLAGAGPGIRLMLHSARQSDQADTRQLGALLCRAMGIATQATSEPETAPERVAPALVAACRVMAGSEWAPAGARAVLAEAAGYGASVPVRITALTAIARRARTGAAPRPAPPAPAAGAATRARRSRPRPRQPAVRPLVATVAAGLAATAAGLATSARHGVAAFMAPSRAGLRVLTGAVCAALLAVGLGAAAGAVLGHRAAGAAAPATPAVRAASPLQAVEMYFQLAGQGRLVEADELWDPRMSAANPPLGGIGIRQLLAGGVRLVRADVVAFSDRLGTADLRVTWVEGSGGQARTYTGDVHLAAGAGGWRWDNVLVVRQDSIETQPPVLAPLPSPPEQAEQA